MAKHWGLIAQTSAAKIYWALATLITTTMTARYLGPAGRGVYVAAVSWVMAFSTFGYLSLSQVIIFLAAGKRPHEWLSGVVGTLLTILGAIAVLGWMIAAALYIGSGGHVFKNLSPIVLLVTFGTLPFLLWIENGNGILMALGKLHILNIAQVTGATASLLVTFLFLGVFKWGVTGGLIALGVSQGVIVALSLGYIATQAGAIHYDIATARELLTGGAKLHLNAIGTYLFTQANVLILNNYRSPEETAYYQLALQLVTAVQIIPIAVSTVAYSLVAREGPDAAWPQHRKLIAEVTALVVGLGVIAYFVSPLAVRIVFGTAFLATVPLLRILLLALIGMTLSIVMASQWIARGLFLQAALFTLAVGGATVIANLIVVPRWGTVGAAWVTVGTYSISIIGNGIMALWVQSQWRRSSLSYA